MADALDAEMFHSRFQRDTTLRQMELLYQIQSSKDKGLITPLEVAPLLQSGYVRMRGDCREGFYQYDLTEKGRQVSFEMNLDFKFDL